MKRKPILYASLVLTAIVLMAFAESKQKKYLVTKEVMWDVYFQIYTTYYTYDDAGRLIRSRAENPDTFTTTNAYSPTGITSVSHNSAMRIYDTVTYTLSPEGRATSDSKGNIYVYDANGKQVRGADGESYTWSDGDIMTRSYITEKDTHVVHYTYTNIADTRDFGDGAWGFRSAHLVETVSDPPRAVTHRYTFDDQGRVLVDSAGGNVYHYYY
jgi:hypothetical protein